MKTHLNRQARHRKMRHKITGTAKRPRLSVYRGNQHLYVQLIDDTTSTTLLGLSDKKVAASGSGLKRAQALGQELAKQVKERKINTVVFDRGGFHYHGQVKTLADTLREAGITV